MNKFDGVSDAELAAEQQRRAEERRLKELPQLRENPDFSLLSDYVKSLVDDYSDSDKPRPKDCKQWIFEYAVEAVYSRETFWPWWNKRF